MSRLLDYLQLEEFNCKVCQESFGNNVLTPRVLNCGHTFCTGCLKGVIKESPICPDCRVPIKDKDVTKIPVVYIVKQLMESIKEANKINIENGIAYLTEDCNLFEAHSGVHLNGDSNTFPAVGTCPLHKAPQQFWCNTCCFWICGSCAFLNHSQNTEPNTNNCHVVTASKHFKNLKSKQVERINEQLLELRNACIAIEIFIKIVDKEMNNNNIEEGALHEYKQIIHNLANKKMELQTSLETVEDSKEKFNVISLKEFHEASKYLDSLWVCKKFPRREVELIEEDISHNCNKIVVNWLSSYQMVWKREEEEKLKLEHSKKEEDERARRKELEKEDAQKNHLERNDEIKEQYAGPRQPKKEEESGKETTASGPWHSVKGSAWRQKEQEKLDDRFVEEEKWETLSERHSSQYIWKEEPLRHKPVRRDYDFWWEEEDEHVEETTAPDPWSHMKASAWGPKEQEKMEAWGMKEDKREPLSERLSSRDSKYEPLRFKPDFWREEGDRDDVLREERDVCRTALRRLRDEKCFTKKNMMDPGTDGDKDRDIDKNPPRDRNMELGPARKREFERGSPLSRDRDSELERGPPPRDREIDFERGPRDRDIERGLPSRDRDKDIERGPPRGDRKEDGFKREDREERRKSFNSWRDGPPSDEHIHKGNKNRLPKRRRKKSDGLKEEINRRRPKEEPDENGWIRVRRPCF